MTLQDFNYNTFGKKDAPWLVFLHGVLGSSANWRRITPAFENDYHIMTFDQRGHGKSFKPRSGYAPEDYAADLQFLCTELGINRLFLIGHSMGGRNALCFTHLYPHYVQKLVIEDIGPEGSPDQGQELVKMLKRIPVPFKDRKSSKEYFLNDFGDPQLGAFISTNMTIHSQGQVVWNLNLDGIFETIEKGRGKDRWREIEDLVCPTLVIRGQRSEELKRDEFEKMKKINRYVRGIEVPLAGHWVHTDQPETFINLVKDFLK